MSTASGELQESEPDRYASRGLAGSRGCLGRRLVIRTGLLSLLVLLVFVLRSKPELIYDEPNHCATVARLKTAGFSAQSLREVSLVSSGPLYAVVHTILRPVTALQPRAMRLANVALLLGTMGLIYRTLLMRESTHAEPMALSLLAAPTVWVISGLALTEMPAMLCAMAATYGLLRALRSGAGESGGGRAFAWAIGAGLAAGLSVTGRQAFLALFLAAPLLATRKNWRLVAAFIGVGAIFPAMLFASWGGISPPPLAKVTAGISLDNGVKALGYAGAMTAIFTMRWFSLGWRTILVVVLVAIPCNLAFHVVDIQPAYSVVRGLVSADFLPIYGSLAGGVLLACGVLFALSSVINAWTGKCDREFLFFCVCGVLLSLTAMKVTTQFSSRYVAIAVPWLLLAADRYWRPSVRQALRVIVGDALGFLMLMSYFKA